MPKPSNRLSIVALVIAIVALVLGPISALLIPGREGPIGPQGPPGKGTIMAYFSTGTNSTVGTSCMDKMQVTIAVPSSGNIVVNVWSYNHIDHTSGVTDSLWYKVSDATADCSADEYLGAWDIESPLPSAQYRNQLWPQRSFSVSAGTHTFHLNEIMKKGQDAGDLFVRGNMVAVFYPS
jgi:hypothetical protein